MTERDQQLASIEGQMFDARPHEVCEAQFRGSDTLREEQMASQGVDAQRVATAAHGKGCAERRIIHAGGVEQALGELAGGTVAELTQAHQGDLLLIASQPLS